MKLFGIRAYRRRGRKYRKTRKIEMTFPNLLFTEYPQYPNRIWASDFTTLPWHGSFLYLATIIDLFTREIIGWSVMTNHALPLILQAFFMALQYHPRPHIFHSDNRREYTSKQFRSILTELDIRISRSHPGSPWQNGYQESFYSQFKVDLGDTNRFKRLGELVYEIYKTIWQYNHMRIHSAFKMPPAIFAQRHQKLLEKLS